MHDTENTDITNIPPPRRLRRLYDWTVHFADTPYAAAALFALAFVESSFFPIPPDVLLIPLVILAPRRWYWLAAIATAGSVLGGLFGYYIGFGFYEFFGRHIVARYGMEGAIAVVGGRYAANAFIAIFGAAFTPIPYKVFTIAAGLFHLPLPVFIIASVLGRGLRFFIVAALLNWCGNRVKNIVERYFNVLSLVFLGLLIAGFVMLKFLSLT